MARWGLGSLSCFNNFRAVFGTQGFLSPRQDASLVRKVPFANPYQPLVDYQDQQSRMREGQHETHTVRTHGVTLARTHMHDWLILILLLGTLIVLNTAHPFYRFVGKDMMGDLKYPMKQNTVPAWSVPIYSAGLPIVIFLLFYLRRPDVYDLHHAILGILFSVLVTAVIVDAIKDAVGRPRPDFFWRCFPDGKDVYDQHGNVVCHGQKHFINDGHKSFPSGHTGWSFAGFGFLSLYFSGKIRAFDRRGHVAKLCIVLLPLLLASLVGISRVDDYRHHWEDVFAGGLIGLVVATFCYLQFFPPPYHANGWGTYAYFRVLEEMQASTLPTMDASTSNDAQNLDPQAVGHQNERINNAPLETSSSIASGVTAEDLEHGRR